MGKEDGRRSPEGSLKILMHILSLRDLSVLLSKYPVGNGDNNGTDFMGLL